MSCSSPAFPIFSVTAIVIFVLLWTVFVQQSPPDGAKTFDSTCNVPERYVRNLHAMVHAAHEVLDGLDLVHFLCYGSLFGQIRNSASLPWERDAEMCLLNEEVAKFDEVFVKRAFWKRGLDVVYDSAEGRCVLIEICQLRAFSRLSLLRAHIITNCILDQILVSISKLL